MLTKSGPISIPKNIEQLKPYVAGKTIAEVQEMYQPERIAKLASNENRLGYSPKVAEAIKSALPTLNDYPDPISRVLRAKIAEVNTVPEDRVLIAAGSESIISILCRTFFLNKENAITADATFVGFYVQAGVRGIHLKRIPVTTSYKFDLRAMAAAVDEHTKMIYIANPNNPTGTYINKNEFEWFMQNIPPNVIVVMDEAYFEYAKTIEDYPHALDYEFDNVLVLRTFSKAYGLAGLRIGYAIGPEHLISNMYKTKLTFEPTALAQAAALAAIQDNDFLQKTIELVDNGRKRLASFLMEQNVAFAESISNSVMAIFSAEEIATDFTRKMLENGVILRQLGSFGLPNCVRITIGTEEDMEQFETSFINLKNSI